MKNHKPNYRNYGKELTSGVEREDSCTYDVNIDLRVAGNLTSEQNQQVETHTQHCNSCRGYLDDLQRYEQLTKRDVAAGQKLDDLTHGNRFLLATVVDEPEVLPSSIATEVLKHYECCETCGEAYQEARDAKQGFDTLSQRIQGLIDPTEA